MKHPELLAPAGSMEALRAAVSAGCDAVYLGLAQFSARASAENFETEAFSEAVRFCSLHAVKTYLTLNTLVKDQEWPALCGLLDAIADVPLTGVILQDLGLAAYIRKTYPGWELHASTQMSITDAAGVRFLEKEGFSRVVLARELSLDEIRRIRSKTDIELEVFVHGAMCYCVSGRCYLSSMIGGRSGNRGCCAQSCRLPYRLDGLKDQYLMNLRDLCALPVIEELKSTGIDAMKIEGRMKSPEYVYGITKSYRRAIDGTLDAGELQEEILSMQQLFNRGGFSKGYLVPGQDMIEPFSPKHQGLPVGTVTSVRDGRISIQTQTQLHPRDVIEVRTLKPPYPSYQLQAKNLSHEGYAAWMTAEKQVASGMKVYRLQDAEQIRFLKQRSEPLIPVQGEAYFHRGDKSRMTLSADGVTVTVCGPIPETSTGSGMDEASILRQLEKTGGTPFAFQSLKVHAEHGLFLPVSKLNALRRAALEELKTSLETRSLSRSPGVLKTEGHPAGRAQKPVTLFEAVVSDRGQWEALRGSDTTVFFRQSCFDPDELESLLSEALDLGYSAGISLPELVFPEMEEELQAQLGHIRDRFGQVPVIAHSLGQIEMLLEAGLPAEADMAVPVMNILSAAFLNKRGILPSDSPELAIKEMPAHIKAVLQVYGRIPVMTSRQCMYRQGTGQCMRQASGMKDRSRTHTITDRKQQDWILELHCRSCYTQLYTNEPVYMADLWRRIPERPAYRLFFLNESAEETARMIHLYRRAAAGQAVPSLKTAYRGHMFKPVL